MAQQTADNPAEIIKAIEATLSVFIAPDQVVELRALKHTQRKDGKFPDTFVGFFDQAHLRTMAGHAKDLERHAAGVYFTLNPVDPDLFSRSANEVKKAEGGFCTEDVDVQRRRWILVDADPVRKPHMSSTEEEKAASEKMIQDVTAFMDESHFGLMVQADSGNGHHLLIAIELPADDAGMVEAFLHVLATEFDTDACKIDTSTFNPSRITKLYGTLAKKGSSTAARPHRRSKLGEIINRDAGPVGTERFADFLRSLGCVLQGECWYAPGKAPASATSSSNGKAHPRGSPFNVGGRDQIIRRARAYVAKLPDSIEGQHGSDPMFEVCQAVFVGFGLSDEEGRPIVDEYNATRCKPPWSEKDLAHKIESAKTKSNKPPGYLLDGGSFHSNRQATATTAPALANESPDDPHRLARLCLWSHTQDALRKQARIAPEFLKLRYWREEFYRWDGAAYRQLLPKEVRASVTESVQEEFNRLNLEEMALYKPGDDDNGPPVKRKVTTRCIGDAMQALGGMTLLPTSIEPPAWVDGAVGPFPADETLAFRNGLVHVRELAAGKPRLVDHTNNFFSLNALDYDFNAAAPQPKTWLEFLRQLWADDLETIDSLQEWFGYLLAGGTRQQKILVMIGPKRSGKGTVARVLAELLGKGNVVGPTLASLGTEFGLWPLLGKTAAIVADARLGSRTDAAIVAERLLSISGEDSVTVNRKQLSMVTGKLPLRFVIITNELPKLGDVSGALVSRMIVLSFVRSWYGREDVGLFDRLKPEVPGILLWAIDGWRRLQQRGRFLQPASGRELIEEMEDLSSPTIAFVRECCEDGAELSVPVDDMFKAWKMWAEQKGIDRVGTVQWLGRNLRAVMASIRDARPQVGELRPRVYVGIRLNQAWAEKIAPKPDVF